MGARYASGKNAKAICDVCGFTCKLKELKAVVVKGHMTGTRACPSCWDPDHPQLKLGMYPVDDPQALRNPRSDAAERAASRELIVPVTGQRSRGLVNTVTVSTP